MMRSLGVLHVRAFKKVKVKTFWGLRTRYVLAPISIEVGLAQDDDTKSVFPYFEQSDGFQGGVVTVVAEDNGEKKLQGSYEESIARLIAASLTALPVDRREQVVRVAVKALSESQGEEQS